MTKDSKGESLYSLERGDVWGRLAKGNIYPTRISFKTHFYQETILEGVNGFDDITKTQKVYQHDDSADDDYHTVTCNSRSGCFLRNC